MPREALMGIGAGLASAAASLAFIAGIPFAFIFLYFSPLPLIAVGLMAGLRVTLIASIVCLLVTAGFGGLLFMLTLNSGQTFAAILVVYLSLVRVDIRDTRRLNIRSHGSSELTCLSWRRWERVARLGGWSYEGPAAAAD